MIEVIQGENKAKRCIWLPAIAEVWLRQTTLQLSGISASPHTGQAFSTELDIVFVGSVDTGLLMGSFFD